MSSREQSVRKRAEGGQHAHVRAPFAPQRHRDGGPDHGESSVPARVKSICLGSGAGGGAHCPVVVVSNHEEASAVAALAVIAGAYAFTTKDRWIAPANGVVKIGVIVPASGPYAILGNSFLKAVEMARSDLRGTKYRYELVPVDIGLDLAQARTAIQRAITDAKVDAIVGGISRFGQVTKPLATAARIPHTCVCMVTSLGDGAYTFTNIPSPDAEAVQWVQEAQRRGIRQIALLTQDYPSIHGHVMALTAELARSEERRVGEECRSRGAPDH